MSQFESLYRFRDFFYIAPDIFQKYIAPFFLENIYRVLNVGKLLVQGLKGNDNIFYL